MLPLAGTIRTAHAQDPVTALARQKFIEGVQTYDAGKFEQARAAFLQAYALKRHPLVLLNLGQSELKAGYPVDGGNHLQQFLHDHKTASAAQKLAARSGIDEAKRRASFAILIVDTDGSQLAIDGRSVGVSPLLDPVFLVPGKHQATASHSGRTVSTTFAARRGSAAPVTLNFATPQPTQPMPAPGVPPVNPQLTRPMPGPVAPRPGMMHPPAPLQPGQREAPIRWFKRKPIAWATTGVTGLGLLGTIGFGIASSSASSAATDVQNQILAEVSRQNNLPSEYINNGQPTPCGDREGTFPPHPYYADACGQLTENLDSYDTDVALMGVSIGLTIAGAGATVAYYLIDTDPAEASTPRRATLLGIAPVVTADHKGLGLIGQF
jgi:hypothetical protein